MYATQCSTVGSLGIDVPHQGGILATLQGTLLVMYAAHRSTVGHLRINLPPRRVNRRPPPVYIPVRNSTEPVKFSGLCASHREIKVSSVRGEPRFGSFSNFSLAGENSISGIPSLSRRSKMRPRSSVVPLASKSSFSYPEMTCKPKWWWRTLACIPYLLPLHNIWSYADVVYHLHPLLQNYEFLVNPFLDTIALMPSWLTYALFMGIYYLVVRRNELPHFLRFHIAMAMLFDTGIQIMGTVCTWMPNTVYRGSLMVHFWLTLAFLQMYTVLDCMRCALSGMYSEVPFLSESAYIHTDLKLF
ncbi:protein TIC 20, chloroplastic-like isoform X1 [Ananas comosus]|uniref:Protein TIC 20 n=2 Tax=Ananas comosus TaxID=4615 RepID=A0A6P5GSR2_ANACO|nr:protein TIC 20, chloroplastic-like isoform X1 [Ananas comosus]